MPRNEAILLHPIRVWRNTQNPKVTMEDLAAQTGAVRETVRRWENGRIPDDKHLFALAKAMDREPTDLLRILTEWRDKHGVSA